MPYINGIEVLKKLRESAYEGQIIIFTAHDEFEYVKDALNHGANAFLLKPDTPQNIVHTIQNAMETVGQRRDMRRDRVQRENALVGMAAYIGNEVIHRIVKNEQITHEMRSQLEEMGIELSRGFFVSVQLPHVELGKLGKDGPKGIECLEKARNLVRENLSIEAKIVVAEAVGDAFSVFIASMHLTSYIWYQSIANAAAKQISSIIFQAMRICVRIGVGTPQSGICNFHVSLWESVQALYKTSVERPVVLQPKSRLELLERVLCRFSEVEITADADEIMEQITPLVSSLCRSGDALEYVDRKGIVASFWLNVLLRFQPLFAQSLFVDNRYTLSEQIEAASDAEELRRQVLVNMRHLLNSRPQKEKYSPIVLQALEYINNNYDGDISLDILSDQFSVTPAYISFLFKRELGQTFMEYLLDVRMNRLMQLLREGDYSVSTLTALLGYRDPAYFCRVVKKATGKTIKQLKQFVRDKQSNEGS